MRAVINCTKDTKLTVIFAIKAGDPRLPDDVEGSIMHPRRWIKIKRVAGTDAESFATFSDEVCTSIEEHMHIPDTNYH